MKPFYEIDLPRKTTKTAFLLVEVDECRSDVALCQHFITNRKHCTQYVDDTCEFCGCWTRHAHFDYSVKQGVWIEDNSGFQGTSGYHAFPCTACATLPRDELMKMRVLRLEINH